MWQKIKQWLGQRKTEVGSVTDFPEAEGCDPNQPCRKIESQKVNGFKITLPSLLEWWFKPKDE